MKTTFTTLATIAAFMVSTIPATTFAQTSEDDNDPIISYGKPDFFRSYDKKGINVFETTKDDVNKPYTGRRINIGAGFTMQFQSIEHENPGALNNHSQLANHLFPLKPGFMTSQANLYFDVQLLEGITMNLTNYLSSRHHNEFWVKGGYLQIDKFPFEGQFWDELSKIITIKAGHMEINYGDAHFRRPDGGQTFYSPFMEGNIMDAFATEIGAEVYLKKDGWLGMIGISNGMIKGHVDSAAANADGTDKRAPSIYLKGGYDKQVTEDVRLRLTGSWYHNSGTNGSGLTLYSGDRTGSNYQNVMEQGYTADGTLKGYTAMYSSGRFNPNFNGKIDAVMINGFAKVQGFEFFGTYEYATGYAKNQTENRVATQYAIEGLYRFGKNENLYGGLRYNVVNAEMPYGTIIEDVKIDRFAVAGGWFISRNILVKAEYVTQSYKDFPNTDFRHNGKFNGVVLEAAISF
ncbi:hypothetical protein JHJ32_04985 [Parapedobacter sp. ISTM3]|uniref:hypothetical protein n=1 Tax=Parapedobacter sp. ISTM3 TaxID=2800130 RepID=UPI001903CDAB|nr:hypothetical protein [Parapedobacter sp. ISTM3]MBK1439334.1 hypothetical protein [Parapedobacter sp. ISTM3]